MPKKDKQPESLSQYQKLNQRLASTLAQIGFLWPGTVQKQMLTCGKPRCGCHKSLEARHGPYWYWTSKKAGKTISKKLKPQEAEIIEQWIENRRRLEAIVKEMMEISSQALPLTLREKDPPA